MKPSSVVAEKGLSPREHFPNFPRYVVASHQAFSHQGRFDSGGREFFYVGVVVDAAFAHQDASILDQFGHAKRRAKIGFEGAEIAVVDPQQAVRPMRKAYHPVAHAHQAFKVVNFNQARQMQFRRKDLQVDQFAGFKAFGNQQNRIRPRRPALVNLVGVNNEILPQYRQPHLIPNGMDVFQFALKILLIR